MKSNPRETLRPHLPYICFPAHGGGKQSGLVAEWLGSALQKLLQRFESAPDLTKEEARLFAGLLSCYAA